MPSKSNQLIFCPCRLQPIKFGSRNNQIATPRAATQQPKYKAADHPAKEAIKGVRTGAIKPPRFEPVFKIPQAAPTLSAPASMVAAQKAPSVEEAEPNDRANRAPTAIEFDRCVPIKSNNVARSMPLM